MLRGSLPTLASLSPRLENIPRSFLVFYVGAEQLLCWGIWGSALTVARINWRVTNKIVVMCGVGYGIARARSEPTISLWTRCAVATDQGQGGGRSFVERRITR